MFEAGYNMKRRRFFRNLNYIALYGIFGTWVSFIFITAAIYCFSENDMIVNMLDDVSMLSFNEWLALGSVLVASDFVPVLSVLSEEQQPRLHSVIFGEGIINIAFAIILFRSTNTIEFDSISLEPVGWFVLTWIGNFLGSISLGIVFGLLVQHWISWGWENLLCANRGRELQH